MGVGGAGLLTTQGPLLSVLGFIVDLPLAVVVNSFQLGGHLGGYLGGV